MPSPSLVTDLRRATSDDRVLIREIDRVAFASDASMYHLVPRAVVLPKDAAEVAAVMAVGRRHRVPVTFRAAGTSLSGQGVTDGILVEVARHWRGAMVEDEGRRIRSRPGMIGGHLNALLAPAGRRLGPDPSSLAACTLGGILANNSSGPCAGIAQNAYQTLASLTFVLPSGVTIDTARPDADELLRAQAPLVHAGLLELRRDLLRNEALRARVTKKFGTKNTTGYALNALLDHDRPVEILAHLLIGSEGTLGFIAEAVLHTVPHLPHTASAFLRFPSVHAACAAIPDFRDAGAQMIELLDAASLRAAFGGSDGDAAALLVQVQSASISGLDALEDAATAAARGYELAGSERFTRDPAAQERYLHARKGLYPAVGGRRGRGTSLLLEDVAFPVERLADAAVDLQGLFRRHGYDDAVIFGHAKDGNLHFLVTQPVGDATSVDRYGRFLDDVVELVVGRYDGALKAEHGTGRNIAPFVETEWGGAAMAMMRRIKSLCDPDGVLSPGVVIPEGPRAHLAHLKSTPPVAAEVDQCVECGYCESVCPSRALTLTPRQRIVVLRERARREAAGDRHTLAALDAEWSYAGLDSCATDGMCATACPVGIDTGALVTRQRSERRSPLARAIGGSIASVHGVATAVARSGARVGHLLGATSPRPGRGAPREASPPGARWIYFPSCTARVFDDGGDPLLVLARRAGVEMIVPPGLAGMCCGLAYGSKGLPDSAAAIRGRSVDALRALADRHGATVVVDGASCALTLVEQAGGLAVIDSVSFARQHLLPRLTIRRRVPDAVVHLTCGAHHLDTRGDLGVLAESVATRVTFLQSNGCCGFAGDRGFSHPELTASATAPMAAEIGSAGHTLGLTSNLTCGIGMARATGIPFRPILALLDDATRP